MRSSLSLLAAASAALTLPAAAVTLDLGGDTESDNLTGVETATATGTAGGVTVTFNASGGAGAVVSFTGLANSAGGTNGGIGIATDAAGNSNIEAGDVLSFSFDQDVFLDTLDFGGIGNNADDSATISLNGSTFSVFGGNGSETVTPPTAGVSFTNGDDLVSFASNQFQLSAGSSVVLSNTSTTGDAFNLNSISFTVVPEPASLALLGLGGLAMLGRRRG